MMNGNDSLQLRFAQKRFEYANAIAELVQWVEDFFLVGLLF